MKTYLTCLQVSLCILVGAFCIALSAAVPYPRTLQLIPLVGDQQVEESAFVPRTVIPANDLQAAATGHGMLNQLSFYYITYYPKGTQIFQNCKGHLKNSMCLKGDMK
jgi:hypothetical protein